MDIETIKTGNKLLEQLTKIENKLKLLKDNQEIRQITLNRDGNYSDSYFDEDKEMIKTIKAMIIDKYERMIFQIKKDIETLK